MPSFSETIQVNNQGMKLYVSVPRGAGPFPAIVVSQHGSGVDEFTRTMADRLAEAGYAAVAPDLYHRLGPEIAPSMRRQHLQDVEIIADVNATVDFLLQHKAIDHEHIGITGFCMGGRVVYLMAAANHHFKAAVAFYGGNIMQPWGEGVVAPVARTSEISCPLLFHFGADDTNPSQDDMRTLDAELTRHGKAHEFHTYQNAGHAFMNFADPSRYREVAAITAWPRTLDFFARYLRRAKAA